MSELIYVENIEHSPLLRVICVADNDAFDFSVLENIEIPPTDVYDFIFSKFYLHKNDKWILIPVANNK